MSRSLCLLPLLILAADAGADAPAVAQAGRPACSGYVADVEVSLGGFTRHGRIIVTADGRAHLEHLDEQARRWAGEVIRPGTPPSRGWDDRDRRVGPPRRVWGQVGGNAVLAEVHTPDGSLRISRHKLLAAR